MILSRRQTHFYASVALACTLSVVFFAGLLWRPIIPTVDESADELFAIANFVTDSQTVTSANDLQPLSDKGIQVFAKTIAPSANATVLEVQPAREIQYADVLVYWIEGDRPPEAADDAADDQTPDRIIRENAVLLGQLSGTHRRHFPLPAAIRGQSGHLILYSRGQNTLIAAFPFTLAPN